MTPLLRVTLAFALGLLPGLRWAPPLALAAAAVLGAAALFACRRERAAVAAAFLLIGVAIGAVRAAQLARDCRSALADGAQVRLTGVPVALPVEGQAVALRATALVLDGGPSCAGVVVRVHVPAAHYEEVHAAALGTAHGLTVTGRWVVHPQRHGWPARAEYAGAVLADRVGPAPAVRAAPLARFRAGRQAALRETAPRQWPLAEALLLAQRTGLTADTRTTWVAAGLVHLLAISGMHVGLIAAGVLALARLLGASRQRAGRAALLITAAYVLFLGAPFAALRALLQAALLLTGLELQRPAEPFTLVAAAAFVIMVIDPLALLDPGFQLSFAGIIGLVAWRRPLQALLPARVPAFLREGLAAGVAASALTTPIAALHFGQAAWIGILATIIATPVLGAALAALFGALLLEAVLGAVPGWITLVVEAPLRALGAIAAAAARVPGGHTFVAHGTVLITIAAALLVIVLRRVLAERATLAPPSHAPDAVHERHARRARRARFRFAIAGAAGLVVVAWAPALLRAGGERIVEIHAIDVGQGDALAVRTPRGRWFLIDAGPRTPRADAGRDRVVPYLQRRGVRRIEAVILTHPDADHIGGAAAVLDAFDVGIVIDPGLPAGKDMYIDLLAAVRSGRQRWIAARAGMQFRADDVVFEFLHPRRALDAHRDANDNSVVFRLGFGSFAALFLGDAPAAVEEELVARHASRLRVAVLKVGHHGSATSTSEVLLATARPALALVSAGQRNRYGHPAPTVLRRLARYDVRVLRTDQLGNVTVRARRDGRLDAHARR
jgi:competence protein ComEC